jgi:hypothetical protein
MLRTIFAVAISGLVLAAISGASQATPITPLSAGVVSDVAAGNVTQVHACGWRCRQLQQILESAGPYRSPGALTCQAAFKAFSIHPIKWSSSNGLFRKQTAPAFMARARTLSLG